MSLYTGLFFSIFLLLAYKGTFIRYIADEYCHGEIAHKLGFWNAQIYWYRAWTGKYSYNFIVTLVQFLGLKIHAFIPFILLVIWIISMMWSLSEIGYALLGKKLKTSARLYVTGGILFTHFWSMPSLGQSFYWQSGAPYTIPLIILTLYIGYLTRAMRSKKDTIQYLDFFAVLIMTLIAGGFSETFASLQLALHITFLYLIIQNVLIVENKKKLLIILAVGCLGSFLSFIFILLAPGNAVRQSLYPPPTNLIYPSIFSIVYSIYFFIMSFISFPFIAFIALITTKISNKNVDIKLIRKEIIFVSLGAYILILSTVVPNLFSISAPPFARNLAIPNFIMICYFTYLGYVIGILIKPRLLPYIYGVSAVLIIAGPILFGFSILKDIPEYQRHAYQWDNQHQSLLSQKNKNIDVKIPALGYTEGLEDISKNPKNWVNVCMASYYNIRSISAK